MEPMKETNSKKLLAGIPTKGPILAVSQLFRGAFAIPVARSIMALLFPVLATGGQLLRVVPLMRGNVSCIIRRRVCIALTLIRSMVTASGV